MDQPRETGTPVPQAVAEARLAALGTHLKAHGFDVELTGRGLTVGNASAVGCCPDVAVRADTITCRRRAGDGGRLWFLTSWQEPIAEADRITDAVTRIKGYLGAP